MFKAVFGARVEFKGLGRAGGGWEAKWEGRLWKLFWVIYGWLLFLYDVML